MRILLSLGALALTTGLAQAQADCGDAWYQCNQIYKEAGYCFQTRDAISAFGNAGCSYDDMRDVPLSANQRARVNRIVAFERNAGCR